LNNHNWKKFQASRRIRKCSKLVSFSFTCVEGTLKQITTFTTRVDKEKHKVYSKPIVRKYAIVIAQVLVHNPRLFIVTFMATKPDSKLASLFISYILQYLDLFVIMWIWHDILNME
jgi:hypothetical protein